MKASETSNRRLILTAEFFTDSMRNKFTLSRLGTTSSANPKRLTLADPVIAYRGVALENCILPQINVYYQNLTLDEVSNPGLEYQITSKVRKTHDA